MTIEQTFADGKLRLSRSPLIVVLKEETSIVDEDSFRFLIEVRVWKGTITPIPTNAKITMRAVPDPDKRGLFNIAPILQDIIRPEDPEDDSQIETAGTWAVQLKYGYILDGAKTWVQNSVISYFTDGFAKQPQLINEYDLFEEVNDADQFCTPVQESFVGPYPAYLAYYRALEPNTRVIYYRDEEANLFVYNITLPTPITTTEANMVKIPIGIDKLLELAAAASSSFNPKKFFQVLLVRTGDFAILDRFTVQLAKRAFCDMEDDQISYVNRFGVWDMIYFKGRVRESIEQSRTEWDRRVTEFVDDKLVYPSGISQKGAVGVYGSKVITLQTGFVRDYINEKMIDLLMSKTHYSWRLKQFVNLQTKNLDLKKDSESELINYTVQFTVAGNLIQNIQ